MRNTIGKAGKTVKGNMIITPKGKALFVSAPNASDQDPMKQEASLTLSAEDTKILAAQLQLLVDSPEAKALGLDDSKFVANVFKEDTDKDKNPTGFFRIKAKTKLEFIVKFYDAKGVPFVPARDFVVTNGSEIRMSISPEIVYTPKFQGIVLRLLGIKVVSIYRHMAHDDIATFADDFAALDDGDGFSAETDNKAQPEIQPKDSSETVEDASGW